MNENEVTAKVQEWEKAGFKFIGNGSENNDDDPQYCPECDHTDIFWALWEHPTMTRKVETDSEYNPLLLNSTNYCLFCGYRWIDVDQQEQ